jgi:hypothetical protein
MFNFNVLSVRRHILILPDLSQLFNCNYTYRERALASLSSLNSKAVCCEMNVSR